MALHLVPIENDEVLAEQPCGRYRVQVIRSRFGGIVYQVLLGTMRIRAWTDAEERAFPKRPAELGTAMVREVAMRLGEHCFARWSRLKAEHPNGLVLVKEKERGRNKEGWYVAYRKDALTAAEVLDVVVCQTEDGPKFLYPAWVIDRAVARLVAAGLHPVIEVAEKAA